MLNRKIEVINKHRCGLINLFSKFDLRKLNLVPSKKQPNKKQPNSIDKEKEHDQPTHKKASLFLSGQIAQAGSQQKIA